MRLSVTSVQDAFDAEVMVLTVTKMTMMLTKTTMRKMMMTTMKEMMMTTMKKKMMMTTVMTPMTTMMDMSNDTANTSNILEVNTMATQIR